MFDLHVDLLFGLHLYIEFLLYVVQYFVYLVQFVFGVDVLLALNADCACTDTCAREADKKRIIRRTDIAIPHNELCHVLIIEDTLRTRDARDTSCKFADAAIANTNEPPDYVTLNRL